MHPPREAPLTLARSLFRFTPSPAGPARLTVRASAPAPFAVTRRMFGKFTEHLGTNVYQGAWAQLVLNPGCEGPSVWGNPWGSADESRARVIGRYQKRWRISGFEPERSAAAGCGFWWAATGRGGRFGLDAGVNGTSQRLASIAKGIAAVVTPVFVPGHRCRWIEVTLWAKAQGGARLEIALGPPNPAAAPFASARLNAGPEWRRLSVRLAVPRGSLRRGRPAFLSVRTTGGGMAWVDQVFAFPADHLDGWDPDVVRYVREAGVSLIRFPGGNFVSGYRWRDGVGPVDARPAKPNPAWEGVEWNHVGTEEWLRFCALVGAEPMVCVNAGDGTPEEAAAWVRYCGRRVRLWEIGNELYGRWQIGWTDAKGNAARYASFARAMRRADSGIELIGCGDTPEWNAELVRRNKKTIRSISVHWLPLHDLPADADPEETHLDIQGDASELVERRLWPCAKPFVEAGLAPKLALDELQILNRFNATTMEALFYASIMHQAVRAGSFVELLTHSALINHGGGLVKDLGVVAPQPVHWAVHLYGTQPGRRPVPVEAVGEAFDSPGRRLPKVAGVPWLDPLALLSRDRRSLVVLVVNRHPRKAIRAEVGLDGFAAHRVEVARLAPPSLLARADIAHPDALRPRARTSRVPHGPLRVLFPRCSITRLIFRH
ncbi:MAG: hypothetical protein AAB152_01820 [Candidatus Coatesbacteria bacterium]